MIAANPPPALASEPVQGKLPDPDVTVDWFKLAGYHCKRADRLEAERDALYRLIDAQRPWVESAQSQLPYDPVDFVAVHEAQRKLAALRTEQAAGKEDSDPLARKKPETMGFISLSEFDEPGAPAQGEASPTLGKDHHYNVDSVHMVVRGGSIEDFKRAALKQPSPAKPDLPGGLDLLDEAKRALSQSHAVALKFVVDYLLAQRGSPP
jgi:hypothetical protein